MGSRQRSGLQIRRPCRYQPVVAVLLLAVLAATPACINVGPDYSPPDMTLPERFEHAEQEGFTSMPPNAELWAGFKDEVLVQLIERGLANNNDIAIAIARFDESRAILGLSPYSNFPTITAEGSSERRKQSLQDPFTFQGLDISDVRQLQFDSTWEIDLFGSLRRQYQQIASLTEASQATLYDVQRVVVGDIVQSYFSLRGAQTQLAVQRENLANQARTVEILSAALNAGRGTALDVARARSLERSVASAIPSTEASLNRTLQRLAVLTASSGAELRQMLANGALPAMPETLDVGTPQQWLRRRPDVRAAERRVAYATATIGVEVAEFYPKLILNGSFGWSGDKLEDIGDSTAQRWNWGPSLQWRFLDFGRVKQDVRAAQAREREAIAQFQNTLLLALEDIENALASYRATRQTALTVEQALGFSAEASELARLRFDNGVSNYLELLDAERTRLDLANQHAQAVTAQATAIAAIYKALAVN